MELKVFNQNWRPVGIVDLYNTLIINHAYFEPSSLKLLVYFNNNYSNILKPFNKLVINSTNESTEVFEIIRINYILNEQQTAMIEVTAISQCYFLKHRVLLEDKEINGSFKEAFTKLYNENFQGDRAIPNIFLQFDTDFTLHEEVKKGTDFLDIYKTLCYKENVGIKCLYNQSSKKCHIVFYKGQELTKLGNSILLNESNSIIKNMNISLDYSNSNTLIYGNIKDNTPIFAHSKTKPQGIARKEKYYSDEYDTEEKLRNFLKSKLYKNVFKQDISLSLNDNALHLYQQYFNVGDVLHFNSEKFNLLYKIRLLNASIGYTQESNKIDLDFKIEGEI